jgi:ubiquinone/menaquinone biosynthesis C-methylase UbiE
MVNYLTIKTGVKPLANVFDEMGGYWAEIADKSQTDMQLKFLKNHLRSAGYVLDLACGTGRHSIPLSQEGYGMVGLDVSVNLLKIAKQRSNKVEVVLGDMRHLPFKEGAFAAAISIDTSFGYLQSEKEDRFSLTEVQKVLFHQGTFVIDVFNRDDLILKYGNKKHSSKSKEYPSFILKQKRTVSIKGDLLCDLWTIREKAKRKLAVFEHTVRLYRQDQLEGLLEKTGFSVKQVYGDYEEEEFSPNSPRLILVANAK